MKNLLRFITIALFIFGQDAFLAFHVQAQKWSPEHVYYGSGGKLTYTPDEKGNIIPDFSHVGYMYGDESIPNVPLAVIVNPVEGDDGANIQDAIDRLEDRSPDANGFRGAILLKKGTYQVSGILTIQKSGIVLRGEGQTDEGTVIIATGAVKRDFIVLGTGSSRDIDNGSGVSIAETFVPLGRQFVIVTDASGYQKGDHIALYRPGTQNWIHDLKMDQISNDDGQTSQWSPSGYSFYFERQCTKVSGDTIFFRNPVVMAMDAKYGGGFVYKATSKRVQKVGVEDLCLKSEYAGDTDEEHAWVAVQFSGVEHGWARRITSWYFGYACVSLGSSSMLVSVLDCNSRDPKSKIGGGRRYSFNVSGSLNLIKNCTTTEGRHDFVNGSRVCGPNVFTNCTGLQTHADDGPHHRWAMGTLFDVHTTDGPLNVQDRDQSGTGHGWAGANQVFWNSKAKSSICQSPWVSALNYNFGFIGEKAFGVKPDRPDGVWVGHNRPGIFPESLYEAQLDSRLNATRYFSVYPNLQRISDTSFILAFNMPVDASTVVTNNFIVGGTAGYEGKDFSLTTLEDSAVSLVFESIGLLPADSTITVSAINVKSSQGDALLGLKDATFIEPDRTPGVDGIRLVVNNEDDSLLASSTRPGYIYLIKLPESGKMYTSLDSLDKAVSQNLGRKVEAPVANTSVTIYTEGLPGGFYNYYAVDEQGRLSEPDDSWPEILETGPVTAIKSIGWNPGFSVWSTQGYIYVQPDDDAETYSLQFFDITGRLLDMKTKLKGSQQYHLADHKGILLVKIIADSGVTTKKIHLNL